MCLCNEGLWAHKEATRWCTQGKRSDSRQHLRSALGSTKAYQGAVGTLLAPSYRTKIDPWHQAEEDRSLEGETLGTKL